ncbi:MAG: hypothetical protein ACI9G1_004589, partial [Pirellulaceae bacterium]
MKTEKIQLGHVVATPNALRALESSGETPFAFLERHQNGDWGNVCHDDRQSNDLAVIDGSRILSVYATRLGEKILIITEAEANDGNRA